MFWHKPPLIYKKKNTRASGPPRVWLLRGRIGQLEWFCIKYKTHKSDELLLSEVNP